MAEHEITVLTPDHPHWPSGLRDLPDMPDRLWVYGNTAALALPSVALIGDRACSAYGRTEAQGLAADLASGGEAIVSGFAYDRDAIIHDGTVSVGGAAVAYLACSLDLLTDSGPIRFAERNVRLAERILDAGGALVSELAPGTRPSQQSFLDSDRLVAAHADALVAVEDSARSMNAVRHARTLGRPVGAVPGLVTSSSDGCRQLIQDGAAVVREADDVLALLER